MPNVLFFRPDFELATEYLYTWFGLGIEKAEAMGFRVVDIGGAAATLENLLDALSKYKFSALFLGGHGNATTFTGQDYQEILKACINDEVVSGNLTYLCSCYTGLELGPSMFGKNAEAYIGYDRDFRFIIDTSLSPLEDSLFSTAQPFQEIVVEVMVRLLRGQSIQDVWSGGVAKCDEWIAKLYDRPEYKWSQVISFLRHNRDGLICLGERVTPPVPPAPPIASYLPTAVSAGVGVALMFISVL